MAGGLVPGPSLRIELDAGATLADGGQRVMAPHGKARKGTLGPPSKEESRGFESPPGHQGPVAGHPNLSKKMSKFPVDIVDFVCFSLVPVINFATVAAPDLRA